MIGVAAGRFHTVLWTREAVYTMGLNGGHLGEGQQDRPCDRTPNRLGACNVLGWLVGFLWSQVCLNLPLF